ncbi:MAG: CoA-binding protein [bacterium]|nr:CoA-binding protein [bacterium]
MRLDSALKRRDLLDRVKRVAMVGASANPLRPSYFVFRYLQTHGYDVAPVNPAYKEIEGTRCYPSLEAYAAECGAPDVVDVFRKPEDAAQVARDAIAVGAPAIWFQYGVINHEAIALADEAGLAVVVDRCMKVEHARFDGGLSVSGMDSGVLSSKRRRAALLKNGQ